MRIVAFISARDACGYYRIFQPLSELAVHGHSVEFISTFPLVPPKCDIFVIGRVGSRDGSLPWDDWGYPRPKIVFDIEDNLFAMPEHHPALWLPWPHYLHSVDRALTEADLVTCATKPLSIVALKHGARNVYVLPNHIDEALLNFPTNYSSDCALPTAGFAGGIGHSPDVESIAPVLETLIADYELDLHFMGADHRNITGLGSARHTPWTPDIGEYYESYDFDIALAPLVDSEFNESKSDIRALEAMAFGVPVVASHSAAYSGLIRSGVNGFLARNQKDWLHYIRALVSSPEARELMGQQGRKEASRRTIQKGYDMWWRAYDYLLR